MVAARSSEFSESSVNRCDQDENQNCPNYCQIKAVYKSGYITCNSPLAPNSQDNPYKWELCYPSDNSHTEYEFELKKNDTYLLEQPTVHILPNGCSIPTTPTGDIVCNVNFSIATGDTLTPTWFENSRSTSCEDNDGQIFIELWAKQKTTVKYINITAIPDVNGDGKSDNATLFMNNNIFYLQTFGGVSGKTLKSTVLGSTSQIKSIISVTVGDDANANGYKEIGILFTKVDGTNVLQLRDSLNLSVVKTFNLPK